MHSTFWTTSCCCLSGHVIFAEVGLGKSLQGVPQGGLQLVRLLKHLKHPIASAACKMVWFERQHHEALRCLVLPVTLQGSLPRRNKP